VAVMAGSVSPATGRRYGVARSSFRVARRAAQTPASRRPTDRRGPKPMVPDGDLPAVTRADLARSPRSGAGRAPVGRRVKRERRASGGRPLRRTEGPGAAAGAGRARASRASGRCG
jgi:hypothetical protein